MMLQKSFVIILLSLFFVLSNGGIAVADSGKGCTPTNIAYCKKNKTWRGEVYKTYSVRCSDSAKRTISYWKKSKQWCVGTQPKRCSKKRLTTATVACRSRR